MSNAEFIFSDAQKTLPQGEFTWKTPSNIALIKYWGKHGNQLPANPSLSFTLSASATKTTLKFSPLKKKTDKVKFEVIFEGKSSESFKPKIAQFFERIEEYIPFIKNYKFEIHTENTFPHSSGIASSASGMAALALCLMSMEKEINPEISTAYFNKKASFLARLGSGSAARSVDGPMMIWGEHPAVKESSDRFAITNPFKAHPVFDNYQNTILIVDKGKKEVSSSLGHQLMIGHPFAKSRFDQAYVNLEWLIDILKRGNLEEFIKIVESEALTLHAMMMTSSPYFLLMKPNTLEIIQQIWKYREENNSHLCFTLDAGANIHLLYPFAEKEEVLNFIKTKLTSFCEDGEFIQDQIGKGPEKI